MSLVNEALRKARMDSTLRRVDHNIDLSAMTGPSLHASHVRAAAGGSGNPMTRAIVLGGSVAVGLVLALAVLALVAMPGVKAVRGAMGPKQAMATPMIATPSEVEIEPEAIQPAQPTMKLTEPVKVVPEPEPVVMTEPETPGPLSDPAMAEVSQQKVDETPIINIQPVVAEAPAPEPAARAVPSLAVAPTPVPAPVPVEPEVPALVEGRAYLQSVRIPKGPTLVMTGIAWSDAIKVALINGMTLEPGDAYENVTVLSVEPKRVQLEAGGVKFYLRMP